MEKDFKYFTTFGIIEFTTEELLLLPAVEQRFLLAASLITNDVRFHWSLIARSKNNDENDDIRTMQLVRGYWGLRKLSSVVFEAQLALKGFVKQISILQQLVSSGTPIISKTKTSKKNLELANSLRNKSAYHYGVGDLINNIAGFAPNVRHRYYAHEQQGNSISALCEQILTVPTIQNAFEGSNVNEFQEWCLSSSNSILHFCNLAMAQIIGIRLPDKTFQLTEIVMGNEAETPNHGWPLFLVVENTNS